MNKKVTLSLLSATVFASMAASAFAAPTQGVYMGGSVDKFYKLDDLFNLSAAAKKQFVVDLNAANPDLDFKNLVFVDFDGKGAKFSEILAAGTLPKAKRDLTKADFEGSYVTVNLDGSNGASYDPRNDAIDDAPGELKVESVSAINGNQLEVKFSTAVKESSVIASTTGSGETAGTLVNGVFTINELTTDGVAANTVDVADNLKATLSADGKTLTISADTYFDGRYEFLIKADAVESTGGKKLPSYATIVTAKDTVKPTLVNVTYPSNATARVNFSEPLSTEGSVSAVYADGTSASVSTSFTAGNKYIDLNLSALTANKEATVTFVGVKDKAGNLTSPNPVTVTVKKDTSDATAPTVQSVTPVSSTAFDIKLSEAVRKAVSGDITSGSVGKIKVGTTDVTANATVDSSDATIIHVTGLSSALTGLQTIEVEAQALVDMSGNLNAAVTKVVNFSADTTAPTVTSTSVETISNVKYLVVNFNEDVTPQASKSLVFNYVKDNGEKASVTVTTATSGGSQGEATLYNPVNGKSKSIKININSLITEDYTVDLVKGLVKDAFGNDSDLKAGVAVTVGAAANQQEILKDKDGSAGNDDDNAVVKVSGNNNKLRVNFKKELDVTSAQTAANYSVEGAAVEKAEIYKNNSSDGYIVELTLAKDSVKLNGDYEVTVRNVKAKDGVAMETYTTTETLVENVVPKVTGVQVTSITQDDPATTTTNEAETKVTLTFSEAVSVGTGNTADFDLYIKGTKVASGVTVSTSAGAANKVVVTLTGKALTTQDFADGVQLKGQTDSAGVPTIDIVDANGNLIDLTNPINVNL